MLLTTKLYPPPFNPNLVNRTRLTTLLDEGVRYRLTLIAAPAGFGKTILASSWLHGLDRPFAWYSLDATDNDPVRFWNYVVAAFMRIVPDLPHTMALQGQTSQNPEIDLLVKALINDLSDIRDKAEHRRLILVLDDYHLIVTKPVHESLNFFLDHMPTHVHLVILSRIDPPLNLARRRGRHEVVEVRAEDLRFRTDEAIALVRNTAEVDLSDTDIRLLEQRTEGWGATLQLAALSLRTHSDPAAFIRAFAGDDRYVVDYLADEVFSQQSEAVQNFLLRTCILERLSGPLCDVLLADSDAGGSTVEDSRSMLQYLDRSNLLLIPLDNKRKWYRYHALFAEMLQQRLQHEYPDLIPKLHRRAGRWFAERDFPEEALHHAVEAEDWDDVARILNDHVPAVFNRGEHIILADWFSAVPTSVIRTRPRLVLWFARTLIFTGQLDKYEQLHFWIEEAEQTSTDQHWLGMVASVRSQIYTFQRRPFEAIEQAQKALKYLPGDDQQHRSLCLNHLASSYLTLGELEEAGTYLDLAGKNSKQVGNIFTYHVVQVERAVPYIYQGQLIRALRYLQEFESSISESILQRLIIHHRIKGIVYYERNDLDEAQAAFEKALDIAVRRGREVLSGAPMYYYLGRIAWAQGRHDDAGEFLSRALHVAGRMGNHSIVWQAVALRIQMHLIASDMALALHLFDELPTISDHTWSAYHLPIFTSEIRVLAAQGQSAQALSQTDQLLDALQSKGHVYFALRVQALKAVLLFHEDRLEDALIVLQPALMTGVPNGIVRSFLDEGEPMGRLLYQASARGVAPSQTTQLLGAFSQQSFSGIRDEEQPPDQSNLPMWIDPLSDRELDVLRLLETGQSNQAIADQLFVSLNTVKTHTKNIYSKLGVNNRNRAVAQAKAIGLI